MQNAVYKTKATTNGNARGSKITLVDNPNIISLSLPKELGGAGADKGYNPEQLIASAYAACFEGAVNYLYSNKLIKAKTNKVQAEVNLLKRDGGFTFGIIITSYFSNISKEEALNFVKMAHGVCPVSYAFKNNIVIEDIIEIA